MANIFGLLITRDDDLLVRQWFARHAGLFKKLAVLDGSTTSFTREVALAYENVVYATDPEGVAVNDQTLRSACYGLLDPHTRPGDWVVICHMDEFFYHSPAKVAASLDEDVHGVAWHALHILPHPEEKEDIERAVAEHGRYDPVALLHHYWYKYDPVLNKYGSTVECRMFRVPEDGVKWGNFNGWVAPVNLPGEPRCQIKKGVLKEFSRPNWPRPFPTYFHYKLFNLGGGHFAPGSNHFAKSRLGTGVGGRRIGSFDDCFFSEDHPWDYKNHSMCERFSGTLPDGHLFNRLGNAFRL